MEIIDGDVLQKSSGWGRYAPRAGARAASREPGSNQVRARLLVRDGVRRDAAGRRGRLEHVRARKERRREHAQRHRRAVRRSGRADADPGGRGDEPLTLMVPALTRAAVVARERKRADRVARRRADGPNAFVESVKPIEDMDSPLREYSSAASSPVLDAASVLRSGWGGTVPPPTSAQIDPDQAVGRISQSSSAVTQCTVRLHFRWNE